MKSREKSRFSFPGRIPWWGNVLMAICSYCTLKYLLPELQPTNPSLQKLIQAGPTFAPLAAIPFLLLAGKRLYDSDIPDETIDEPENRSREDGKE